MAFDRDVEVFLTGSSVSAEDVKGRTVVVIDVLRTSTTIVAALNHGARSVVPVADLAAGGKIAAALDPASFIMGGEKGGMPIEGYHLGNSPFEYTDDAVSGKAVILHTTNGTPSILRVTEADAVVVGGFVNAQRVVDFVRAQNRNLTIVCAGWRNRVALEDTLCAGLLLHRLWEGNGTGIVSDTAHIALTQYRNDRDDLAKPVRRCNHAQRLRAQGFEDDIDVCIAIDSIPVLPLFRDSRIEAASVSDAL
jgi:2-phosphosulfolactate phosphatase